MTTSKHLLFELGSEELPPKNLLRLSKALLDGIVQGLHAAELTFYRQQSLRHAKTFSRAD